MIRYNRNTFYRIASLNRSEMKGRMPRKLVATHCNGEEFVITQHDMDCWEVSSRLIGEQPMLVSGWVDGLRVINSL